MDQLFNISLFASILRVVAPILLAALGGAICARVGLFNVGLEGMMLTGAFTAIVGNYYTGNIIVAVLCAIVSTMIVSLLFGYMSIHLKANVIIVGISINFLALGLTTFGLRAIFHTKGAYFDKNMVGLPKWNIPLIDQIPWVGKVLSGHSPLVYLSIVLVFTLHWFLFKTVTGFRLIAAGENATASRSLGLRVAKLQYLAVLMCGVLCGLAGAQLSLGNVTMFSEGMTEGRGFIALVATMLGQSSPFGVAGASLLFGFMESLNFRLQGFSVPTQISAMLPYVMTLIAMLVFKDKSYLQEARKSNDSSR
ncbi:ABC transporter permease [Paenibacillus sp. GXUN7292]|uniref:ABC transporter permease n=1 Tax=Paenibacillus sp. GXUN7292 TaxID=3422499 RepID=UPI003D7CECF2